MAKYPDVTAGQVEACINRMGGWNQFLRFIGGKGKVVFDEIFNFIYTKKVKAQPAVVFTFQYVVNELRFFGERDEKFEQQFLDNLQVPATEEKELAAYRLYEETPNIELLRKLGEKAEINVSQFLQVVKDNDGAIHSIAGFLRGKDGNLWVVTASPGAHFPSMSATPVEGIFTIDEGTHVLAQR